MNSKNVSFLHNIKFLPVSKKEDNIWSAMEVGLSMLGYKIDFPSFDQIPRLVIQLIKKYISDNNNRDPHKIIRRNDKSSTIPFYIMGLFLFLQHEIKISIVVIDEQKFERFSLFEDGHVILLYQKQGKLNIYVPIISNDYRKLSFTNDLGICKVCEFIGCSNIIEVKCFCSQHFATSKFSPKVKKELENFWREKFSDPKSQKIKKFKRENRELHEELITRTNIFQQDKKKLEETIDLCGKDMETSEKEKNELRKKLVDAREEFESAQIYIENYKKEENRLQKNLVHVRKEFESAQIHIENCEKKISMIEEENRKLRQQNKDIMKIAESSHRLVLDLQTEKIEFVNKTKIRELHNIELLEKIKIQNEERIQFQNSIRKLQEQNGELEVENAELRREIQNNIDEIERLAKQNM